MSMASLVTLSGRFVRLEPLESRHLEQIRGYRDEAETWRYMRYSRLNSLAAIEAWFERIQNERARGQSLTLAVIDLPSGAVAGSTSLYELSPEHRSLEIGRTWYGQRFQRTYVNTECKLLLLRHAFETLG